MSQSHSLRGTKREPATDLEARATQTPIPPSRRSPAEPKEGETVHFSESALPAIVVPAQWDAIATTLTYDPSITKINPPQVLTDFGRTDTRIEVNKSSATQSGGTFNVELVIENVITFWVAGGTRTDIASDSDPDITQANYPTVVQDLTPSPTAVNTGGVKLLKNQPRRTSFWAEDLTIKHECFHAEENEKFGRQGAIAARDWLNGQTAQNYDEVEALVGRVSQMVASDIITAMAPPAVEQRAYDAGAADYLARARAIKTKGDAQGYAPRTPAP